jgi:hypothetical protein
VLSLASAPPVELQALKMVAPITRRVITAINLAVLYT